MAYVEILSGAHQSQWVELAGTVLIGRNPNCTIQLDDALTSRHHARITQHETSFFLEDLHSRNGTMLKGEKIPSVHLHELSPGDEIKIGNTRLRFHLRAKPTAISQSTSHSPDSTDNSQDLQKAPTKQLSGQTQALQVFSEDETSSPYIVATCDAAVDPQFIATPIPPGDHQIEQSYRRLQAMCQISFAIGTGTDLPTVMNRLLDSLYELFPNTDRAMILLPDQNGTDWIPVAAKSRHRDVEKRGAAISRTIIQMILDQKCAILSSDALTDSRFKDHDSVIEHAIRCLMCAPLLVGEQCLGLIQLDSARGPQSYSDDDLKVLVAVAAQAALAVKQVQLLDDLRTANSLLQAEMEQRQLAEVASIQAQAEAARLQAIHDAKSTFLANMSHELRTPMNGIMGMAGLLFDTELTLEQQEYANHVRQAGETLLNLINDLLDYSNIETGNIDLDQIDFGLHSIIEEVLEGHAETVRAKGLELGRRIELGVPNEVAGDPERLRQVLTKLVDNAVKFTDQGEVAVRVSCIREEGETVVVHVEIRDTGIGMAPDVQATIFDPFIQVDGSATRQHGGAGLGLGICKELIDLMGGTIGVESIDGEGSTFWFTVPLRKRVTLLGELAPSSTS